MAGEYSGGTPLLEGNNRLLIDAITTQMQWMMREQTEELHQRIDQLERNRASNHGKGSNHEGLSHRDDHFFEYPREKIERRQHDRIGRYERKAREHERKKERNEKREKMFEEYWKREREIWTKARELERERNREVEEKKCRELEGQENSNFEDNIHKREKKESKEKDKEKNAVKESETTNTCLLLCKNDFSNISFFTNEFSLPSVDSFLVQGFNEVSSKEVPLFFAKQPMDILVCKEASLNHKAYSLFSNVVHDMNINPLCSLGDSFGSFDLIVDKSCIPTLYSSYIVMYCKNDVDSHGFDGSNVIVPYMHDIDFYNTCKVASSKSLNWHELVTREHTQARLLHGHHYTSTLNACRRVACEIYYGHKGILLKIIRSCLPHSFICAFLYEHMIEYFDDIVEEGTNLKKHTFCMNTSSFLDFNACAKEIQVFELEGFTRLVFDPGDLIKIHQIINSKFYFSSRVANLCPLVVGIDILNSRTNSFEEGGNDENMEGSKPKEGSKDDLQGLGGPMTRARAKRAKEALNQLVVYLNKEGPTLEGFEQAGEEPKMVHFIQIEDQSPNL